MRAETAERRPVPRAEAAANPPVAGNSHGITPTASVAPQHPAAAPHAPAASAPIAGGLDGLWNNLVEAVGRVSPFTRGYLIDAHLVSFEKGILVIGFDPEFEDHLGLVDNSRNHTLLATKLSELGHPNAMIKFVKAEAPAGWVRRTASYTPTPAPTAASATSTSAPDATAAPAPAPAAEKKTASVPFSKEDFKNDPLIQKALEVFKGTIIEVRV